MKILRILFWWLFVLCIPLLLISSTAVLEINCLPFYEHAYQKYHISEVTGFDNKQLMIITRHLIQFFNGKVGSPQLMVEKDGKPIYLFHDYEIKHLNDVKVLFQRVYQIQLITMFYFLCYLLFVVLGRDKKRRLYFWKGLRNGNILTLGLLLISGVALFFGFHNLFTKFHYLVFGDPQNSPWMLNPKTDYLIMMYPLGFWQDAVLLGIAIILITTFILIGISSLFLRRYRKYTG